MATCELTESCPFFTTETGYSPELNHAMRQRFCLGDNRGCARFIAFRQLGRDAVPNDLLPSDCDRLPTLGVPDEAAADCKG